MGSIDDEQPTPDSTRSRPANAPGAMADLPARTPEVQERREKAIETISRHYTSGQIDIDEFETRLDRLYRAGSVEEILEVQADLPSLASPADHREPGDAAGRRDSQLVLAVLGGTERKGTWTPARRINAFALMGGLGLDFRQAVFAPGVTELTVIAMMGGVEILVPPGLRVECEGFGLLGGFEGLSQGDAAAYPGEPTLRIRGIAIMGGVEVTERLPGESAKERKRRMKHGQRGQDSSG